MKNIEEQLARAALQTPSEAQRARMNALFYEAMPPRRRFAEQSISLWQCAAACVICLATGYVLASATRGETAKAAPPRPVPATSTNAPAKPAAPQFNLVRQRADGWVEITVMETSS